VLAGDVYVFQQDNAPAHRARATIEFLRRETPAFIPSDFWPANSPDLNPVYYCIWGRVQQCVYQKPVKDVDELKQRLVRSGLAYSRPLSMTQSTNGEDVFGPVFE